MFPPPLDSNQRSQFQRLPLPGTSVNAVVLPGGNRRVLSIVLLPELPYPLQALQCRRRWRRRECPRHSHLFDDALEARRGEEQQRRGRLRRRIPPGVQRSLGDVEDRPGVRRESTLTVQDFQLPLQEAISFVRAVVDVRWWLGSRQGDQFHQCKLPVRVFTGRLDRGELVVRFPERRASAW